MVILQEIDEFESPSPSDSLDFKETLNPLPSNSPAYEDTSNPMFKSVMYVEPYMVGPGLSNLGNTCFLNAVLQCLTHTVPLVESLRLVGHVKPCNYHIERFCLICTLLHHIDDSVAAVRRVVSPLKLVNHLSYISPDFKRFQQEDAHEFLQCLLNRLDSNCALHGGNVIRNVFGGSLVSRVQCCNCGHFSETNEPLIDLSLEIKTVDTLLDSLKSFTDVETIQKEETNFTCEGCKEVVSIEKQLQIKTAPAIALFHLKRFENHGLCMHKIDKHVDFPLELDLSPYYRDNSDAELKYYLYAIVVHDLLHSDLGHYYSFICSAPDEWYMMNDCNVQRVSEEFVLSQEAYILFYAKIGTPWFSSIINKCGDNSSQGSQMLILDLDSVDSNCDSSSSGKPMVNAAEER